MERVCFSFLAGAATVTLAVVWTGAYTLTFFGLGFVSAIALAYLAGRLIGRQRIVRWLAGPKVQAPAQLTVNGRKARPVDDDTLYARYQRMPKKEKIRAELDAWNEAFERDLAEPATVQAAAEAVSALENLKVPAKAARRAVAQAQKTAAPEFEPLFTSALNIARNGAH
jgi:hypothetical protein